MTTSAPYPPAAASDAVRNDLRNLAIVAHVDHGKTTLVDAMLRQSGVFRANEELVDRVMDSGDLEREKGITILAKQTTVEYHDGDVIRLNIVDTPGHADFGGEVERTLLMVDAVLLLVDAAEGPLPQTRYVLQKALARDLPSSWRSTRSTARTLVRQRCSTRSTSCSSTSARAPSSSTSRSCTRTPSWARPRQISNRPARTCGRCSTPLVATTPPPTYEPDHPLQLLVTNLSANDYVGRMAVGRIWNGTLRWASAWPSCARMPRRPTARSSPAGTSTLTGTVTSLTTAKGIERVEITEAGPGEIVAVAGIPEVTIGDTITDPPIRGRCRGSTWTSRRCR